MMHNRRNYYRILNIQPDAPIEIVRSSYRTLMQQLKHHPDLGGDHWNAVLINEAYAILTDPVKRAEYDHQQPIYGRGEAGPIWQSHQASTPSAQSGCPFCQFPHGYGKHVHADTLCSACQSPLYPAPRQRLGEADRRAITRVAKRQPISFYTRWPQPEPHTGETQDISPNGMQFTTSQLVSQGQVLKLECDVCRGVAEVTYCEQKRGGLKPRWIVGVTFVSLRFERLNGTFVSTHA